MAVKIDSKSTKGYQARVYFQKTLLASKMYSINLHDGWEEAQRKAINWENRIRRKLRSEGVQFASDLPYRTKKQSNNRSGVAGVHYTEYPSKSGKIVAEWVATWNENGRPKHKAFRVTKDRDEPEAFVQAVEHRSKMTHGGNRDSATSKPTT